MVWTDYFKAVDLKSLFPSEDLNEQQIGSQLTDYSIEEIQDYDIIIFNVEEDRAAFLKGSAQSGDHFRKAFYSLYWNEKKLKVADLGTLAAGDQLTDTYFALEECLTYFLKQGVLPIVIGGSQDLALATYRAYGKQEQLVNLTSIDSAFRLGDADDQIRENNFLSKILLQQPNVLFNYSNLGYQTYLVDSNSFSLLDELFYDIHRLGKFKTDMKLAEPLIRNADFISFSMNAIAQPYSPAASQVSPNGFTGEEACQLARYAGFNDKLTAIGFYDYNPSKDQSDLSAKLLAQMVWYFFEGFNQRKQDFPACNKKEYVKYTVAIDEAEQELVFYKSPKSDRWWMEVPYHANFRKRYERHLMLPCNYEDYQTALQNEIPDRWFQTYQKLK